MSDDWTFYVQVGKKAGERERLTVEGIEVALNPEELDLDTAAMQAKYEQTVREQQSQLEKEDLSDMVAEHAAKQQKVVAVSLPVCKKEIRTGFHSIILWNVSICQLLCNPSVVWCCLFDNGIASFSEMCCIILLSLLVEYGQTWSNTEALTV